MSESIGVCEGLCGGLVSHHLEGGLCPQCRANPNIRGDGLDAYDGQPLGAEADVRHAVAYGTPALRLAVLGK